MFTEDQSMISLRYLFNRGTVICSEIADHTGIDVAIVEEIMSSSVPVDFVRYYSNPPSYILTSTGEHALKVYSLRKYIEFHGGMAETF